MKIKNRGNSIGIIFCLIFTLVFQHNISYANTSLPEKYDLREQDRVTSVKDQRKINGCWAFAALSSLESNIKSKENIEYDFSENNMITNHGFDLTTEGGNKYMATAYLTSWKGAVLEEKDPYPQYGNPINRGIKKSDYHVQNVIFTPERKSFNDNDKIKKSVMDYGAVYTNLKWDDLYYNSDEKAYRNNSLSGYDHTVTIVGWDDNFSKDNFKDSKDCGDGAFICKNNWGSDWGENGYFYVSYYDFNIGKTDNAVFLANDNQKYDNIYQYDELGQTDKYGFSTNTAWFSNVFESKNKNENLNAVSFYTLGENSDYEIWVCNDFKGLDSFKNKKKLKEGTIDKIGYHTISFDSIELKENEKFAVIVKITTQGSKNPIAVESPDKNYSSKAEANKNESFISSDGSDWSNLADYESNTNVCLKAFTNSEKNINEKVNLKVEQIEKNNFTNGEEANIKVKVKNEGNTAQKVALMVGLYNEKNKMINHSYINEEIKANEEMNLSSGILVPYKGKYKIKGFVWDDSDNGNSLIKEPIEIDIK